MTAGAAELAEAIRLAVAAELEKALGGALDPAESPRSALSRSA